MERPQIKRKITEEEQRIIDLITEDFKRALRVIQQRLAEVSAQTNRKKESDGE